MAQNVEKVPKGSPKSSFFRAQSVIFGSQIRESGPLRKYHYLVCFNNIIAPKIDAGTHQKSMRERNVRQRRFFSLFYMHFMR